MTSTEGITCQQGLLLLQIYSKDWLNFPMDPTRHYSQCYFTGLQRSWRFLSWTILDWFHIAQSLRCYLRLRAEVVSLFNCFFQGDRGFCKGVPRQIFGRKQLFPDGCKYGFGVRYFEAFGWKWRRCQFLVRISPWFSSVSHSISDI